jgi:hypothetical protein
MLKYPPARKLTDFERGFKWATDSMTSGRLTPEQVEEKCSDPFDPSAFDRGGLAATTDFKSKQV